MGRVLNGDAITSGEFKAASDMVVEARAAVPLQPLALTLNIVHRRARCPECQHEFNPETNKPLKVEAVELAAMYGRPSPQTLAAPENADTDDGNANAGLPKPTTEAFPIEPPHNVVPMRPPSQWGGVASGITTGHGSASAFNPFEKSEINR